MAIFFMLNFINKKTKLKKFILYKKKSLCKFRHDCIKSKFQGCVTIFMQAEKLSREIIKSLYVEGLSRRKIWLYVKVFQKERAWKSM